MDNNSIYEPEDNSPPAFWTPVTESDIVFFKEQSCRRRFDVSLVYAVANRCSAGFPQVVVCLPVTSEGVPFPTMFWLTCPFLIRRCGELESLQKISDLEEIFKTRLKGVAAWHQKYSMLRAGILKNKTAGAERDIAKTLKNLCSCGVGGINWEDVPYAAKCLHLQTATWLGWNYHPASDWLAAEIGATECNVKNCINTCKH